jgi:hypothetical protein
MVLYLVVPEIVMMAHEAPKVKIAYIIVRFRDIEALYKSTAGTMSQNDTRRTKIDLTIRSRSRGG